MIIIIQIQEFLKKKLTELKLERQILTKDSGIPYSTITHLLQGTQNTPSILTIIKMANYFHCFVDEIVGRGEYVQQFRKDDINYNVSLNNIDYFIKQFLLEQIAKNNINIYQLSRDIGFSRNVLHSFMYRTTRRQKTLNTKIILSIADYFKVSTDKILGRISK